VRLQGIGKGKDTVKEIGEHQLFGEVNVITDGPANLLSLGHIRRLYSVYFNDRHNRFILTPRSKALQRLTCPLVFSMDKQSGVYMYNQEQTEKHRKSLINTVAMAEPSESDIEDDFTMISPPLTRPPRQPVVSNGSDEHFNPKQMELARQARALHNTLGHPNDEALVKLLDNGGILDCHLTGSAIRLSNRVFGPCPHCIQAQMRDSSGYREPNAESISEPAEQIGDHLIADILYVPLPNGKTLTLMVTLEELINAAFVVKMPSKNQKSCEEALFKAIGYFRSQNCRVTLIKTDHESNLKACAPFLGNLSPPVRYKSAAPGTHASRVERFIEVLRDKMRAIAKTAGIPIPPDMYYSLVLAAVSTRNQVPNANSGNIAPFQHITNWKPSLKGSLRHKFGDLVIVKKPNVPTGDKWSDRGERAIYLYPNKGMNHSTVRLIDGSSAGEIVSRDNNPRKMRRIPMTEDVISILEKDRGTQGCVRPGEDSDITLSRSNNIESQRNNDDFHLTEPADSPPVPVEQPISSFEDFYPPTLEEIPQELNPIMENTVISDTVPIIPLHDASTGVTQPPSTVKKRQERKVSFQEDNSTPFQYQPKADVPHRLPRAAHNKRPVFSCSRQLSATEFTELAMYHIRKKDYEPDWLLAQHISLKKGIRTMKEKVEPAVLSELQQMKDLGVFDPINYASLTQPQREKVVRAFMFITEKYLADGTFDKVKARLVADKKAWSSADSDPTTDPSSPTADFLTACIVLNLICLRKLKTAVIDVKAAYLNAAIDEEIHITLDQQTAAIYIKQNPSYKHLLKRDGTLCCKLNKALYGLPQSGKLWYQNLRETLCSAGFQCHEDQDKCLFSSNNSDGTQSFIVAYVDDLLIAAPTDEQLTKIISILEKKYKKLTIQRGRKYSWLGLTLEFSADGASVDISQHGYIADLASRFDIPPGRTKSPYPTDFLKRPTTGPDAKEVNTTAFRSQLMAAAYLGIRTRPDIRFAVSHLASRSTNPNLHDQKCLDHLYKYIQSTSEYKIRFNPTSTDLNAYIDASFAIHLDGRGQTGILVIMGNGGPLYVQSSKQKLLGHNSTQCELIAVNDFLFTLEHIRNIYEVLNIPCNTVIVNQDNSSAMHIAINGHGNSKRSKYMTVRVEHINQHIQANTIKLAKCSTKDMYADILTKPIYGNKLKALVAPTLNISLN
jgi:hypothetical protein